ncbi:M56 family metallopeptidase [Flavobacteriaceae bacterium SZ-1-7]|uniref:M56 family metallopeptidase n=1 Tax=Tamlana sedimenti TaxID=3134126 RepID=UPI003123BE00
MVHYIFQTIVFQLFFLLVYDVWLKKETFFNCNRAYLLTTMAVSFILPFIKIERFKTVMPQEFIISLPEVILGQPKATSTIALQPVNIDATMAETISIFTWENLFYLGATTAFVLFSVKLLRLLVLIRDNPKTRWGKLTLIHVLRSTSAFSFFNYIFLGEQLNEDEKATILKHEMVHAGQNHTLDLLFFELLRIVLWFNPFVYIYQNRIVALHEFIADAQAVKHQSKTDYYQNLLAQVFQTKNISIINPFYKQSLIKKRIVMLQKRKSKQIHLLKYVLLIPLVFGMLVYSSCAQEKMKSSTYEPSISEQLESLKKSMDAKGGKLTDEEKQNLIKLMENVDFTQTKSSPWKVSVGVNNSEFNEVDVPFSVIEQPPVFADCEKMSTKEEQKSCTVKEIFDHVARNFNSKIGKEYDLSGRQRINVIFKIDKEGNVTDVSAKAPVPALEEEAIRVVQMLPKFEPGAHNGKAVNVPFSLPIIFEIPE